MVSFPQVSPIKALNKPLPSPILATWLDLSRNEDANPTGSGLKFKKPLLAYALHDEGLINYDNFLLEKIRYFEFQSCCHTNVLKRLRVTVYFFQEYDSASLANRIPTFRKNVISTNSRTEMSM